jgi:hypothetical protein
MSEVLFEYSGKIYIRPCGRGLCIGDELEDIEDAFNLPYGWYVAEIKIKRQADGGKND